MLLSTRSRYTRLSHKRHFLAQTPSLTPKSASPATNSKNFRLRRSKVPLRGTAGCLPAPALGGLCGKSQYSKRASSALLAHPKISKACGAPEEEKKNGLHQQKTQEGSCGALLVLRSSIEPASERPTCSRTRAPISDSRRSAQREAQQSTKRSTAKHGVISGGEQARVRTSCRHLGIELRIASAARYQNFPPAALRSCARGA